MAKVVEKELSPEEKRLAEIHQIELYMMNEYQRGANPLVYLKGIFRLLIFVAKEWARDNRGK